MKPPVDAPTSSATSAAHVDAEGVERVRQLDPAARHVGHRRRPEPQLGPRVDQIARLLDGPVARQHLARQDQRPRFLARRRQPLLDQGQIGADALGFRLLSVGASRHRGMIPADRTAPERHCKPNAPA